MDAIVSAPREALCWHRYLGMVLLLTACSALTMGTLGRSTETPAQAPAPEGDGLRGYVVSHTHSDFAWADSIAGCLDRNVAAVARSVELAEKYPDFHFCMEHMLAVREFLRRNPEKLDTVRRLMSEGRFEAGGFYTGPWELTSGGEALVRQLYFGKLWVKNTLGVEPVTVWNVDVAGHTAQLPQILSKAGIKGLVISSGSTGPNLLQWQSRDGSSVLTWRTPWWYSASDMLGLRDKDLSRAITNMPRFVSDVLKNANDYGLPKIAFIADGSDIQSPSEHVVQNIQRWNADKQYPPLLYASTREAFAAVENARVPCASGEMPSPWDTVQAQGNDCFMRDRHLEGRLSAAEKFATFRSIVDATAHYPRAEFEEIWANRLYTFDHNWGGKDGEESDRIKAGKIATADRLTDAVLQRTFAGLAAKVHLKARVEGALPIVVFNPLSWRRHEAVICELPLALRDGYQLQILSGDGVVPSQCVRTQPSDPGARVVFQADVPALGYATYYAAVTTRPAPSASPFKADQEANTFESRFYRVQLNAATGSISSLLDKQSGRELVRTNSAYGCNELVAFEDTDEDIGMHLTGKRWLAREQPSKIQVVEDGPVRLVLEISGKFLDASERKQQIVLYADSAKIDFITALNWAGKRNVHVYEEFPLNVASPTVKYAVPFGWERFGDEMKYAAPWFSHDTKPVTEHRWRGVRGWVQLDEQGNSVTLASDCNYAAFRDLGPQPEPGFLIQPLLLRTIRSCGGTHFFYEQRGQHEFRFALQAHADPTHVGEELDSPLLPFVPDPSSSGDRSLPERLSFLSLDAQNVHVATVKVAEDGQGVIVRLVEMQERDHATRAELQLFQNVRSAQACSILEENRVPLSSNGRNVAVALAPSGIETLRLGF